jgi:23S rRNA (guanosine2251-2'-O)-methyltransferase
MNMDKKISKPAARSKPPARMSTDAKPRFRSDRPAQDRPDGPAKPRFRSDRPVQDRPDGPAKPRFRSDRPAQDRPDGPAKPRFRSDRPAQDRPDGPAKPRFRSDRPFQDRPDGPAKPRFRSDRPFQDRPDGPAKPRFRSDRPAQDRPDGPAKPRFYSDRPIQDRPERPARSPRPAGPPSNTWRRIVTAAPPEQIPHIQPTSPAPEAPPSQEPESGANDRLEGRNTILEAIKAGRAINKLWVAKREDKPDPGLGRLISLAKAAGAVVLEVERRVLDQMTETHGHQGVIAQVAAHEYADLDEVIQAVRDRGETPFVLALAELQDGYNLGAILRIADAAGVDAVIIPQRRSVGLDAAVAKASAGAIEHVPVCRVTNLNQTLIRLKADHFWIAGTDADATLDYHQADWMGPLVILIGSEGEGLNQTLHRQCDFHVAIPMRGKVNSLNAAVAAGIVVFEAAGRRGSRVAGSEVSET